MSEFIAMIILKPDIENGQIDFIQSDIINLCEEHSKVKKVWFLGKRKLDYKIKKYTEGYYLKFEITTKSNKVEQIREQLRINDNIIFSIIINNENEKSNLSVLKKCTLLFNKKIPTNNATTKQPSNKVYMLISKNLKIPFAESNILAVSQYKDKIFQMANKKLQEYIYAKGYYTTKEFKSIKDLEKELKRSWKVDFVLGHNPNVGQQLIIQEKYLI